MPFAPDIGYAETLIEVEVNPATEPGRAPTRRLRIAVVSLYALENNGVRHVSSSLRQEGFSVTEIYFKDWVNNRFPWPAVWYASKVSG